MFSGSYVALVTPMKSNDEVDIPVLKALIDWHIDSETDGIVALGTTGESVTLSPDERKTVIKTAIKTADGKVPVIVGVGTNCTQTTIDNAKEAEALGADALLVVTPYYNKPTQEGLYQHYKAVHDACSSPIILYNVPGRTACDLKPETVARLAKLERIVGIKEAVADSARHNDLRKVCPKSFALLSGDDGVACDFVLKGGHGVISVTANVAPKAMSDMIHAAIAKDEAKAHEIDSQLSGLHHSLFLESNPIPVKWALSRMGRMDAGLRLPLTVLSECYHAELEQAMEKAGVL